MKNKIKRWLLKKLFHISEIDDYIKSRVTEFNALVAVDDSFNNHHLGGKVWEEYTREARNNLFKSIIDRNMITESEITDLSYNGVHFGKQKTLTLRVWK